MVTLAIICDLHAHSLMKLVWIRDVALLKHVLHLIKAHHDAHLAELSFERLLLSHLFGCVRYLYAIQ